MEDHVNETIHKPLKTLLSPQNVIPEGEGRSEQASKKRNPAL